MDKELNEQDRLEKMHQSIDFIATLVSSYRTALIEKGIPPGLAAEMVMACSGMYWDAHMCALHGSEEEDESQ